MGPPSRSVHRRGSRLAGWSAPAATGLRLQRRPTRWRPAERRRAPTSTFGYGSSTWVASTRKYGAEPLTIWSRPGANFREPNHGRDQGRFDLASVRHYDLAVNEGPANRLVKKWGRKNGPFGTGGIHASGSHCRVLNPGTVRLIAS